MGQGAEMKKLVESVFSKTSTRAVLANKSGGTTKTAVKKCCSSTKFSKEVLGKAKKRKEKTPGAFIAEPEKRAGGAVHPGQQPSANGGGQGKHVRS